MSSDEKEQQLNTYRGNCHCKAFVYEVQLPEIKAVNECNCSICHKKGYLWVFPETTDRFKMVRGDEAALTGYKFGPENRTHKFCPTCATPIMAVAKKAPANRVLGINAHAIQNLDTWALQKKRFDFSKLEPQYEIPEHKGAEPTAEVEGGKVYIGGCHCGAVTISLKSKPLDETFEEGGLECNCSICERNGYLWTYPLNDQVVLHAKDPSDIGRYAFATHMLNKTFCKTCGVNLTNEFNSEQTDEERANLPEGAKKYLPYAQAHHPVNLRVLPEVDIDKLTRRYVHGSTSIPPLYVNP